MIAEVTRHREGIAALCERYGVRRLELIGSAAAGGYDPLTSDIDFLVTYPEGYDFGPWLGKYFDLRQDLRDLLRTRVDLVMSGALRHDWFRESVEATREVIYDAATVTTLVE